MTQFKFESEQAAWEYYLNLDSHHFEEKQHNNIYTDAFEAGAEWEHKRLVHNACEWLLDNAHLYVYATTKEKRTLMFDNFKKAIEE